MSVGISDSGTSGSGNVTPRRPGDDKSKTVGSTIRGFAERLLAGSGREQNGPLLNANHLAVAGVLNGVDPVRLGRGGKINLKHFADRSL